MDGVLSICFSEGNYVMKPAEDVDECPRTYDMMEFAGF